MLRFMVFLIILPCVAVAEGVPAPLGALSALMQTQILEGPQRFEAYVAGLILGYGTVQGISAQGLEDYLAVERAKVRVREMRRMMLADLDDDSAVTQQELFVVMSAQGANGRGTLWQAHSAADTNGDGTVARAEMEAQARMVAARSEGREGDTRALMQLDFNHDGRLTTLELRHAMTLIAPET